MIRVTRVVSAVAAGRILNSKTARGQILASIVGGIGMALHEETLLDYGLGRMMDADIAEYHVPVNADVRDLEVIVEEPDALINPLGSKGVRSASLASPLPSPTPFAMPSGFGIYQ